MSLVIKNFDGINRVTNNISSNNCVGEQKKQLSSEKSKLKVFFALLNRCSTYLKSASVFFQIKLTIEK